MRYYIVSLGCPKNAVDAEGLDVAYRPSASSTATRQVPTEVVRNGGPGMFARARAAD